MGRTTDLIDAVLADLVANVTGWPASYAVWKYAERKMVTPELCPLLAITAVMAPREIIATDHLFARKPVVEIRWFTSNSTGAETGGAGDDAQAAAMLDMLEAIGDRCEIYADGIPGLADPGHFAEIAGTEIDTQHGAGVWEGKMTLEVWQA